MKNFTVRNFVIISHIDHGKSTLADRFLQLTGQIPENKMHPQYLDSMSLEREKGITIKMHPCRMVWKMPNDLAKKERADYCVFNLIDTPGHIDFSYEISRAMAAVEGAILLVDASQGVQAQTLFNLETARSQGLEIIGLINKIDIPGAKVEETKKEVASLLEVPEKEILEVSAKLGWNVGKVFRLLVEKISPPKKILESGLQDRFSGFCALIFDCKYDPFFGVISFVRVFNGEIRRGDKIYFLRTQEEGEAKEIGYFSPQFSETGKLAAGEIGYIKTGIREPDKVRIGDTIIRNTKNRYKALNSKSIMPKPLPGYKEPKPVLFLSLYPTNPDNFLSLKRSLLKLRLNDAALSFREESKTILGRGFRCGFLGSLHAEISIRRLKNEFGQDLISTFPQVIFRVLKKDGKEFLLTSPAFWPDRHSIKEIQEPWVQLKIVTPQRYLSRVFEILISVKSELGKTEFFSSEKYIVKAEAPLREIINSNFYDRLKKETSGYASFSFQEVGFRKADLVKLDILIAGERENAFSRIVAREKAFVSAKKILKKLKESLPHYQFDLVLQGAVGGKIIARETIKARRKDVTAPLYGGDVTRKNKLLKKQKKGKKKLKERRQFTLPSDVFLKMLKP
ncbi:translation elongation factor 4 [bacterium]|nr:translation elongation factor 4 [bacterium]